MNLRDPYTNLYMSSSPYAPKNPLINSKFANIPDYYIPYDFSSELGYLREYDRRMNAKNTLKTSLSNNNINPANVATNVATQSINSLNGSAVNNYNEYWTQSLANDKKRLEMMEKHMNTQDALGITNTTINSITGLTQLGLGIDAYFQNKKLNKQAIKNAELSNQQLERDMEYIKNERNRLNRIRSNTNNSINAKSSTSRVYA